MSDYKVCLGCGSRVGCDCTEPDVDIELLADLAHRLWWHWSQYIAMEEEMTDERVDRWETLWVEYSELPENMKDKDRELVEEKLRDKRHPENKWDTP